MRISDLQELLLARLTTTPCPWEPTVWGFWRDGDRAAVSRALRRLEAHGLVECRRVSGRVVSARRTTC